MFADWDCIFRKLCAGGDGRVDPRVKPEDGHDGVGESILSALGISLLAWVGGLLSAT